MYSHVLPFIAKYYYLLPCITMYCHVLPCTAMYSHVLPCITMYCHVLLCITMYCHVLPCTGMIFTIDNGSPSWLFLGIDSTAKKTYPRVATDKQIEIEKCGNCYTYKIFSKIFHFEQNGSGWLHSVLSGKYHGKCNVKKRFFSVHFRRPFDSKGCLKFTLKDFPR